MTAEVEVYEQGYVPALALSVPQAIELVARVDEIKRAVMRPDVDYGVIPGTDRPSLLQPGAQRLLQCFGLGHAFEIAETEYSQAGEKWGITVRATAIKGDMEVGSGLGYCSYDEDRYFQSAEQRQERENANATRYNRAAKTVTEGFKAPWNTLLKMAQKRALVGCALNVTASSGLFTQDREDETTGATEKVKVVARALIKELPEAVRHALPRAKSTWGVAEWCQLLLAAGAASAGELPAQDGEGVEEGEGDGPS